MYVLPLNHNQLIFKKTRIFSFKKEAKDHLSGADRSPIDSYKHIRTPVPGF